MLFLRSASVELTETCKYKGAPVTALETVMFTKVGQALWELFSIRQIRVRCVTQPGAPAQGCPRQAAEDSDEATLHRR
mgnify:CR=1 FL=1